MIPVRRDDFMKRLFIVAIIMNIWLISGCNNKDQSEGALLELSPTFTVEYIDNEGQERTFTFRGIENKIGITDAPLVVGTAQKVVWHFWDEEKKLIGNTIKVKGTSVETGKNIILFESSPLTAAPNLGATTSVPSGIKLTSIGLWKLDIYVGEKYYGSIVVEGKESY